MFVKDVPGVIVRTKRNDCWCFFCFLFLVAMFSLVNVTEIAKVDRPTTVWFGFDHSVGWCMFEFLKKQLNFFFFSVIGIGILCFALILSAGLGHLQEYSYLRWEKVNYFFFFASFFTIFVCSVLANQCFIVTRWHYQCFFSLATKWRLQLNGTRRACFAIFDRFRAVGFRLKRWLLWMCRWVHACWCISWPTWLRSGRAFGRSTCWRRRPERSRARCKRRSKCLFVVCWCCWVERWRWESFYHCCWA